MMNFKHHRYRPSIMIALACLAVLPLASCAPPAEETATVDQPVATPPSASSTAQHYSGGTLAPAGHYRPADEQGPAQNVPKPQPPENMNIESAEALKAFLFYWNDLVNYAIETGNIDDLTKVVSADLASEMDFYTVQHTTYVDGGWNIGGKQELHLFEDPAIKTPEGNYVWSCYFVKEDMTKIYGGKSFSETYSELSYLPREIEVSFSEGEWRLTDLRALPHEETDTSRRGHSLGADQSQAEHPTGPSAPAADSSAEPGAVSVSVEEFQLLPLAAAQLHHDTAPHTLKNYHTNIYATASQQAFTQTIAGTAVEIRAVPVAYIFDYGDSTGLGPTPHPGYSVGDRWDIETPTSHQYTEAGDYLYTVTTIYRGEYRIGQGPWRLIGGSKSVTSQPQEVKVWRVTSGNVADTCQENPNSWGCTKEE